MSCAVKVIVVPGTESGPVFYEISHDRDGRLWTVKQRFSTLDAMRHGLWKKRLPLPDVPFPRKQAPLLMFVHKWHAPGTLAMPAEEMEERREGLQAYMSELSGLKDSWRSDVVTEVLCLAEDDATSASASPAGNQANEAQPPSSSALPPPVTKAVSWVDQQTPATALTDFAARPDEAPHCTPRSPPPPPPPVSALSSSSKLTPPSLSLSSPKPTAEAAAVAAGAPTSSTTTPGDGGLSASDSPDAAAGSVLEETRDADVGEGSAAAAAAMGAPAAAAAAAAAAVAPEDSTLAAANSCEEKVQEPTAFLSPPKGPADAAADADAVADGPAASLQRTEPRLLTRRVRERARKRLEQQSHAATAAKPGSGGGDAPADTAAVDPIPVADSAAISTPPVSLPSSPIRPAPFAADEPGEAGRVSQLHNVVSVSSSPAAAEPAEKTSGVPPGIPGDAPATAGAVASPAGETTAAEGERNTGGGEEEEDGGAEGAATVQQPGIPSTAEKGETQGAAGSSGGGEKEGREAAAEGGLPESTGTPGAEAQAGESLLPSLLLSAPTAVVTAAAVLAAEIAAEKPEEGERLGQQTEPPLSGQTLPATALPATETAGSQDGQTEESVAVAAAPVEDQTLAEDEREISGSEGASAVVATATGGDTAEITAEKPEDEERLGQQTEPPSSGQTLPATALPASETAGSQDGQTEESVAVATSPVEDQSLAEDEEGASGSEGASAVVATATATGGDTAEITAEKPEDEERLGQQTEPPLSDQTSPATALPARETAGSPEGQTEESVAVAAAPVEDQSLAEDEGGASGSEGASAVVAAATGGGTSPAEDYTVALSTLDAQDPSDSGSEEASAEVSAAKGSAAPVDGRTPAPPAEEVAAEMQEGPPAEHAAAEDSGADAQTLSILAVAAAAADAAVEQEGREERDRGHASAVSALTLSSATEDYTEEATPMPGLAPAAYYATAAAAAAAATATSAEAVPAKGESREANVCCADGPAAAPGELAGQTVDVHPPTSLPTPTTATKGRASLLNRARWSLSSKKATADTKQKDAAAAAAAAAGGVNPAEDLAQEEAAAAAAAAAAPSKPLSLSSTTTPTAAGPSAFTPRTASRLASLRNKARGWRKSRGSGGGGGGRDSEGSGPLSDGRAGGSSRGSGSGPLSGRRSLGAVARRRTVSGPLSLSSARSGKGGSKGFFSSMSKSPEAAAGDSDGHKGEEGLPAPGEETGGDGGVSPGGLAPASGSATGNPAQADSDDGALAPVGGKGGPPAAGGGGGGFDGFAVPPSPSEG
ncbi:unnamed protein product [Ectocarpus sp. 6 AP-2014]